MLLFVGGGAAQNPIAANHEAGQGPVGSAVVQILAIGPGGMGQNQECSATGFFVNEDGYILTNAHVVDKARECLAQSPGGKILAKPSVTDDSHHKAPKSKEDDRAGATATAFECDVVAEDEVRDLAILIVLRPPHSATKSTPFVLLEAPEVPVGTRVKVTGHPAFAFEALADTATVVGRKSLALNESNSQQTKLLILDTPLKHGNSGSPVYLEANGSVVGIVERRNTANTQQSLAIPIRYAIEFLDRLGVKWHGVQ